MKADIQFNIEDIYSKIQKIIVKERVFKNVKMGKYTSFRTGGSSEILLIIEQIDELKQILSLLTKENVPHILLGNGSNILVKDGGYRGVIIKLGDKFNEIEVNGKNITAYAGARISTVAKEAMENSLTGMEFASGIPGSVGGGVYMNAGAYGGEIQDIIQSVKAISKDGSKEYELSQEEMKFNYRHSIFHENGDIIISAVFKLEKGDRNFISSEMKQLMSRRNEKQPVNLPSAGSFFKRPEGYFAGKLIQDSGLKGLSVGGAQVSPLHAGFIVNNGEATATDILDLMRLVQNTVFDKFGVKLEPEVRILGD